MVQNTCNDVKDNEIDSYGKTKKPQMSFKKIYDNCSGGEKCFLYGGILASIINGLLAPVWILVFGEIIDSFDTTAMFDMNPDEIFDKMKFLVGIMFAVGIMTWV